MFDFISLMKSSSLNQFWCICQKVHIQKSDNPHKQLPSQWRSVCFVTARRIASANPLNNSLSFSTYCRMELMSIEEKDELIKMQKATRYKVRMRLSAVLAQISCPLRLRQAGKLPVRMWPASQTEKLRIAEVATEMSRFLLVISCSFSGMEIHYPEERVGVYSYLLMNWKCLSPPITCSSAVLKRLRQREKRGRKKVGNNRTYTAS